MTIQHYLNPQQIHQLWISLKAQFAQRELTRIEAALFSLIYDPRPLGAGNQRCAELWIPDLPTQAFYDVRDFAWNQTLTALVPELYQEYLASPRALIQSYTGEAGYAEGARLGQADVAEKWLALALCRDGEWQTQHCQALPLSYQALQQLPLAPGDVMFSVLKPRSRIPAHHGLNNYALTYHLALKVSPGASLTVDTQKISWHQHQSVIFDDSFLHSAENDSDDYRVILLADFWHPLLTPVERAAISQIQARLRALQTADPVPKVNSCVTKVSKSAFVKDKQVQDYAEPQRIRSWENLSLHRAYIADTRRNQSYQAAISAQVKAADRVLDIGSGSGILAMMSARRDAKVTAIEWSDLIYTAKENARRNQLAERIEFVQADARNFYTDQKYDVITHELIGAYLWDENLLDILKHAKEHLLAPGGKIIPGQMKLFLVPVQLPEQIADYQFWQSEQHEFDFSAMAELELDRNGSRSICHLQNQQAFLAQPLCAADLDLNQSELECGSAELEFMITQAGYCTGLLGFMEIGFGAGNSLSTAPAAVNTNWGQFHLFQNIGPVQAHHKIKLNVQFSRSPADWRIEWQYD